MLYNKEIFLATYCGLNLISFIFWFIPPNKTETFINDFEIPDVHAAKVFYSLKKLVLLLVIAMGCVFVVFGFMPW